MTFLDPFADLAAALSSDARPTETEGVRIDSSRRARTGAPEIVYGKGRARSRLQQPFAVSSSSKVAHSQPSWMPTNPAPSSCSCQN